MMKFDLISGQQIFKDAQACVKQYDRSWRGKDEKISSLPSCEKLSR